MRSRRSLGSIVWGGGWWGCHAHVILVLRESIWFVGWYHAACDPCGTISLWRADRVRKVNRESQFKAGDSARMKERRSDWGSDRREERREAYLGQSTRKCTTERERGSSDRGKGRSVAWNVHAWAGCGQDYLLVSGPLGGGTQNKQHSYTPQTC